MMEAGSNGTVVLVHGGFVDGSGWRGVGSHAIYVSQPAPVADLIERAVSEVSSIAH